MAMASQQAILLSTTNICSLSSNSIAIPRFGVGLFHCQFRKPEGRVPPRPFTTTTHLSGSLTSKPINTSNCQALICLTYCRKPNAAPTSDVGVDDNVRRVLQVLLWVAEAVYILWLFLLPYAPGDPVWAISSETVNSLIGLSLNFFFVLPCMNSVGIRVIDAPVLHPMSEGLFNFVIAWTLMFAPLLFTDRRRDRYKGSLDVLWGCQMFLTNTFLIPYMAIRLNEETDAESSPTKPPPSQLDLLMTRGAPIVGIISGGVCIVSALWAILGRVDGNFGTITERLDFLGGYLGSERLGYAFIWDIVLYSIFQPWLIGDNLQNVEETKVEVVSYLRFVPVVGLIAYLLCLDLDEDVDEEVSF